jgi:hypothetical protein
MLKEAKRAMGITYSHEDGAIAQYCEAGAMDLETRGVILPGTVAFTITETPILIPGTTETEKDPRTGETRYMDVVTDNSTLTDALCMRAIITFVMMNYGNPPNQEWLQQSYETQLGQLMTTSGYTNFGDDDSVATE